jgi:hypothetical protein
MNVCVTTMAQSWRPLRPWLAKFARIFSPITDIGLITANFGGIDTIKPLPPRPGIDAFYYTDAETAAVTSRAIINTWKAVIVSDRETQLNARLRAKYFKQQIQRLPEAKPFRWLVWADSSFLFKKLDFIKDIVEKLEHLPPHDRLMLVPHPHRQTVRQEIDFVLSQMEQGNEYLRVRYGQAKTTEAIEHLESRGFSLQDRLWCGGFWIIENNSIISQAWDAWWAYTCRYGTQDQYFLPAAMTEFGLRPQALNVNIFTNQHFDVVQHLKII